MEYSIDDAAGRALDAFAAGLERADQATEAAAHGAQQSDDACERLAAALGQPTRIVTHLSKINPNNWRLN